MKWCTKHDRVNNQDIRNEFTITSVNSKTVKDSKRKLIKRVDRMSDERLPKQRLKINVDQTLKDVTSNCLIAKKKKE